MSLGSPHVDMSLGSPHVDMSLGVDPRLSPAKATKQESGGETPNRKISAYSLNENLVSMYVYALVKVIYRRGREDRKTSLCSSLTLICSENSASIHSQRAKVI